MNEIFTDKSLGTLTQFEILNANEFSVRRHMDAQKIIDRNKEDQNGGMPNKGYTPSKDMKHVARIPILFLEIWAVEAGIPAKDCFSNKMQDIVRKKLNDPEWKFLRTGMGRI